jgi:hypothetical protein
LIGGNADATTPFACMFDVAMSARESWPDLLVDRDRRCNTGPFQSWFRRPTDQHSNYDSRGVAWRRLQSWAAFTALSNAAIRQRTAPYRLGTAAIRRSVEHAHRSQNLSMMTSRIFERNAGGSLYQSKRLGVTDPKPSRGHSTFPKHRIHPVCARWDQAVVLQILDDLFQGNARIGSWADVRRVPRGERCHPDHVHDHEGENGG